MNRQQRRAAERQALVDAIRAAEFVLRMQRAREAAAAKRLFLERGVKLVALPNAQAVARIEQWQQRKRVTRNLRSAA